MTELISLHCQSLSFDPNLSAKRLKNTQRIFPIKILFNILCLCLYLLGMKRSVIASTLNLSPNTVRSKIGRFLKDGTLALFDRRKTVLTSKTMEEPEKFSKRRAVIEQTEEEIVLEIADLSIAIPKNNHLQVKAVLLTFVQNELINRTEAAEILNLSSSHIGYLRDKLKDRDIHSLIDQRKGQKQDYKFTPEIKSELIQIFTINSLTGKSTSGKTIGVELGAIFETSFSERSIRYHMSKLGLSRIKRTLPTQYELEKKMLEIVTNTKVVQIGEICFKKVSRMERRIEIISLIKDRIPTKVIRAHTGCHVTTIMRWKNRDEITDLTRSGRPLIYKEEQRLRLIGFYCQALPKWGGRWSIRTAEKHLAIEPSDIGMLSKSTINRILLSHDLKPHRSSYFLNITDPDFFQKMPLLIELFLNRPKNLYAIDESPGIQILQRLVPNLQTEEMKKRLEEFEYVRNGTLDLFLCLDVNNGKINCEIYSNHDTEKFVLFMENHFKSVSSSEPLHYVLDNLNTHCSYAICQLVAEYSHVRCPPGERTWHYDKTQRMA